MLCPGYFETSLFPHRHITLTQTHISFSRYSNISIDSLTFGTDVHSSKRLELCLILEDQLINKISIHQNSVSQVFCMSNTIIKVWEGKNELISLSKTYDLSAKMCQTNLHSSMTHLCHDELLRGKHDKGLRKKLGIY